MNAKDIKEVVLNKDYKLEELIAVARFGAKVAFSEGYRERVNKCRALVDQFVSEKRRMYGITTGLGENVKRAIPEEAAIRYQKNTMLTHCTSVGEPMEEELVRGMLFMMLANVGTGVSGARMKALETIAALLNKGVTPWVPIHGSVGYLDAEAHAALVFTGAGRAYYNGELLDGKEALERADIEPFIPSYKEGLCFVNGCTSINSMGAIAAYDARNLAAAADVIAACTLEALSANLAAFDERVMAVKPHKAQAAAAKHIRELLADSEFLKAEGGRHLQDALSLRCVPQAHGAARKTIDDAVEAINTEINSCDDNPIIHPSGEALSACNSDAGFVGVECDSICIALTYLAKISERRTDRMVNEHVSGLPPFLVAKPGENSGYMIVQYSSAGLLGEMRVLSHPASVDSVPTCAYQEDYVSMGYNAAMKAYKVVRLAEYVLGNELLTAAQAADLRGAKELSLASATTAVAAAVREKAPFMEDDHYISPDMEWARELVHSGRVREIAEKFIGKMY
ncbi:MAG: aromatic amino acid ammonia-lyase [Cloacibacillus sp.]